jgi:hypothetical protein
VTITGVDDAIRDGNVAYSIVLGAAASADAVYNLVDPSDVAATNQDNEVLAAPAITATFSGATNVSVTWPSVSGAASYELQRSFNGSSYAGLYSGGALSFTDSSCPSGTTCLYRVRSVDPIGASDWRVDLATTLNFTDAALSPGSIPIKAVHFIEARTAVNAVRTSAGLGAFNFTDSTLLGTRIKAIHMTELRSALDAARAAIGLQAIVYGRAIAASTPVHAVDLAEIRDGTR